MNRPTDALRAQVIDNWLTLPDVHGDIARRIDTEAAVLTPPAPTPTPPPTRGLMIHHDSFASYPDNTALHLAMGPGKPYTTVQFGSQIVLDPTVGYLGGQSMRYDQPGGTSNTPQISMHLARPLANVWLRVPIRWSKGFTCVGVPGGGIGYKILGMSWSNYYSRLGTQVDQSVMLTHHFTVTDIGSNTSFVVPATYNEQKDWLNMSAQWQDQLFHDFIIHFAQRPNNVIQSRQWIDGVRHADISYTLPASKPLPLVGEVMIGQNFNQVRLPGGSQSLWIGEVTIVEGGDPFGKGA